MFYVRAKGFLLLRLICSGDWIENSTLGGEKKNNLMVSMHAKIFFLQSLLEML